jgi:hypothetical protein
MFFLQKMIKNVHFPVVTFATKLIRDENLLHDPQHGKVYVSYAKNMLPRNVAVKLMSQCQIGCVTVG